MRRGQNGRTGYAPEVRGMAAALAYVDDFLPIHDLRSLHELVRRLEARQGSCRRTKEPTSR